jgi:hypothetical protein
MRLFAPLARLVALTQRHDEEHDLRLAWQLEHEESKLKKEAEEEEARAKQAEARAKQAAKEEEERKTKQAAEEEERRQERERVKRELQNMASHDRLAAVAISPTSPTAAPGGDASADSNRRSTTAPSSPKIEGRERSGSMQSDTEAEEEQADQERMLIELLQQQERMGVRGASQATPPLGQATSPLVLQAAPPKRRNSMAAATQSQEASVATMAAPVASSPGISKTGALFASIRSRVPLSPDVEAGDEKKGAVNEDGAGEEEGEREKERLRKIRVMRKEAKEKEEAGEEESANASTENAPSFASYRKMRKMGLPDGPIRQKMLANGEEAADIAAFFGEPAPNASMAAPVVASKLVSSTGGGAKGALLASIRGHTPGQVSSGKVSSDPKSALFASIRTAKLKKSVPKAGGKSPAMTPQQVLMASIQSRKGRAKTEVQKGEGEIRDDAAFATHLAKSFEPSRLLQVLTDCDGEAMGMVASLNWQQTDLNVSAALRLCHHHCHCHCCRYCYY